MHFGSIPADQFNCVYRYLGPSCATADNPQGVLIKSLLQLSRAHFEATQLLCSTAHKSSNSGLQADQWVGWK